MNDKLTARSVGAWVAALYLALQLLAPLYVIARAEPSSYDFSWDMFSFQLSCESVDIGTRFEGEPWVRAPIERDFASWAQFRRLLSEKRFRAYGQKLCREREREHPGAAELRIGSRCRTDRDAQPFAVLDPAEDFCMSR